MNGRCLLEYIAIFILVCGVSLTSSLKNKKYHLNHRDHNCTERTSCLCVFPDGSGIDISKLPQNNLGWVNLNDTASIYYSPCVNLPIGADVTNNECLNGTSVCLQVKSNVTHHYIDLGRVEDGHFVSTKQSDPVLLKFNKNGRQTVLKFTCNDDATVNDANHPFKFSVSSKNATSYDVEIISSQPCVLKAEGDDRKGLSTGSVLVLMFVTFTLIYFGGGMLMLKLLRGAEGKEMIPNYDFWADLPYLVRDGILFCLSGFQPSPSYDRI